MNAAEETLLRRDAGRCTHCACPLISRKQQDHPSPPFQNKSLAKNEFVVTDCVTAFLKLFNRNSNPEAVEYEQTFFIFIEI